MCRCRRLPADSAADNFWPMPQLKKLTIREAFLEPAALAELALGLERFAQTGRVAAMQHIHLALRIGSWLSISPDNTQTIDTLLSRLTRA